MSRDSNTRSGMLWEVERILDECENKPQILLMENVPDVIGTKNVKHFSEWLQKLESLGYKCYFNLMNAKNYGIPQSRNRCFMISILGDYNYDFPEEFKLKLKLEDLLEKNVAEKYYLSDKAINGKLTTKFDTNKLENCIPKNGIVPTICARDYKDPKCVIIKNEQLPIVKDTENYIEWFKKGFFESECRAYKKDGIAPIMTTSCGKSKVIEDTTLKKQLCNKLISENKVKENDVIRHSYSNSRMNNMYIQNNTNHNCCPTLDTRCDCLGVVVKESQLKTKNKRLKSMLNKIDVSKTKAIDIYNQSVHDNIHTIKTNIDKANMTAVTQNYRIRKFTPLECFRLMGVKDEDYYKIAKNQSNSSLYHLAGDSIVVNVLMYIFNQMVGE